MVDDFQRGNIIPFLAPNIGACKNHNNTLSILDITIIEEKRNALKFAFHVQIKSLEYG